MQSRCHVREKVFKPGPRDKHMRQVIYLVDVLAGAALAIAGAAVHDPVAELLGFILAIAGVVGATFSDQ